MNATPRPPRSGSEKRKRSGLVQVRCTEAEAKALDEAATVAGMSVAAFMRRQSLGDAGPRAVRRPPVERRDLAQLLGQLGKCGSNLNQIARALNTGHDRTSAEIAAAVADIRAAALAISVTLRGVKP